MDTIKVVLATCNRWPNISRSDQLYANALAARGVQVIGAPWNGPFEPFAAADAVIIRSTWDYHSALERYLAWLTALEGRGIRVFNPVAMLRANLDKRYLLDLAKKGIPSPTSRVVELDAIAIRQAYDDLDWDEAVLKPTVGASGFGVALVRREEIAAWVAGAGALAGRQLMVQELIPEIRQAGERSIVFFGGEFSHALAKTPLPGDIRVNSDYDGKVEATPLPDSFIRQARAVLDAWGDVPLYARIDGVPRGDTFILIELELNEPSLWLHLVPGAADRFAEATLRWFRS
jgi:glutathione synthase/RimK-type ligase-like ATP-grasp enzyme